MIVIPPGKGAAFVRLLKRKYLEDIRRRDRIMTSALPRGKLRETILRITGNAGDQGLTLPNLVAAVAADLSGDGNHCPFQSNLSLARAVHARLPGLMRHWYIEPVSNSHGAERRYRLANRYYVRQTYIAKHFRHLLAFPPTRP